MATKEKNISTLTYDCGFCGSTYWIKVDDPVTPCACGFALTRRKPGEGEGAFVMLLQLCRRDAEGEALDINDFEQWEDL